MAGEWIKMRTNLWDDPRVAAISDRTGATEGFVIGGLYWLWSIADSHSVDGRLPGLTHAAVDRKVGIPGFGEAVASIGWITFDPNGALIARFDEHNGASAKARASHAKRAAASRGAHGKRTESARGSHDGSTGGAPREERDREKKDSPNGESPPSPPMGGRPSRKGWSEQAVSEARAVIAAWNDTPDVLPVVTPMGDGRKKKLRARVMNSAWCSQWRPALAKVAASDFCRGQNDRGWRASFDWFIKPETAQKLIEGQYDGKARDHPGHVSRFAFLGEFVEGGDDAARDGEATGLPVERDGQEV